MAKVDRLDYLSALDPAHAYGLGPKPRPKPYLGITAAPVRRYQVALEAELVL